MEFFGVPSCDVANFPKASSKILRLFALSLLATRAMTARQPAIFIPHGGGPAFFMPETHPMHRALNGQKNFLASLPSFLPQKPSAILLVSAHWEVNNAVHVSTGNSHNLLYDYYGFPPETYELEYPAAGSPALASKVIDALRGAGIQAEGDAKRGWDHGVFIPLKVVYPKADVPVVAVSILESLDPEAHVKIGEALAKLRDENVLILGSGMSYHNLGAMLRGGGGGGDSTAKQSLAFDNWLNESLALPGHAERRARLARWKTDAPYAKNCHPREEHLIPLHVIAGAGKDSGPAKSIFNEESMSAVVSAWLFE